MSELSDALGLTSPRAQEIQRAWDAVWQDLGLDKSAGDVAYDFLLEHSSRIIDGLPPGTTWWNIEENAPPETMGVFPPPWLPNWRSVHPETGMAIIRHHPRYFTEKGMDTHRLYRGRVFAHIDDDDNIWLEAGLLVDPKTMRVFNLTDRVKNLIWKPWFDALGLHGETAKQFQKFLFEQSSKVRPSQDKTFFFPTVPQSRYRTSRSPVRDDADWIRANVWHHAQGKEGVFFPGYRIEDEGKAGNRVWFFNKIPPEDHHLLGITPDTKLR